MLVKDNTAYSCTLETVHCLNGFAPLAAAFELSGEAGAAELLATLRRRAHGQVARAVASGELVIPEACESCGAPGEVEAHHGEGYSRLAALRVRWLCRDCHAGEHAALRRRLGIADGRSLANRPGGRQYAASARTRAARRAPESATLTVTVEAMKI